MADLSRGLSVLAPVTRSQKFGSEPPVICMKEGRTLVVQKDPTRINIDSVGTWLTAPSLIRRDAEQA